jgi:hypothetical protein
VDARHEPAFRIVERRQRLELLGRKIGRARHHHPHVLAVAVVNLQLLAAPVGRERHRVVVEHVDAAAGPDGERIDRPARRRVVQQEAVELRRQPGADADLGRPFDLSALVVRPVPHHFLRQPGRQRFSGRLAADHAGRQVPNDPAIRAEDGDFDVRLGGHGEGDLRLLAVAGDGRPDRKGNIGGGRDARQSQHEGGELVGTHGHLLLLLHQTATWTSDELGSILGERQMSLYPISRTALASGSPKEP